MPTAVLTGCGSGIGHSFAQALIDDGYTVYATDVKSSSKLTSLKCKTDTLDVRDPQSISAFVSSLNKQPVDILLNVAGIMSPAADDALETSTKDIMARTLETNTIGPFLLTQALLPNLLASSQPRVGIVSSRVGSMGDNSSGGSYAYRASKAAVNSIGRNLAVDLKDRGVVVSLLHPGFVKTALDTTGKTHKLKEAVEPEEAATKLWGVMKEKTINDTGKFWHREGYELPW
ncbi:3-oxoacyl-reductase, partial [Myriangium duriaei CBS 260.36]